MSRKLLLGALLAWGVWTGRVQYITTVTHQQGINCEYDYEGQRFWRAFVRVDVCPEKVWVE